VAPNQFELASVYEYGQHIDRCQPIVDGSDQDGGPPPRMVALCMRKRCGVNGSGKHNKWSIRDRCRTKTCSVLAKAPMENEQFLVFLTAIIIAVDV
jgi:glutamine synthetase type III